MIRDQTIWVSAWMGVYTYQIISLLLGKGNARQLSVIFFVCWKNISLSCLSAVVSVLGMYC